MANRSVTGGCGACFIVCGAEALEVDLRGPSSLLGAEVLFTALTQVNTCHNCPTTRLTLPLYAPLTYKLDRHTVSAPYCATKNDLSIAHLDRLQSHHRKIITRRIPSSLRRPAYKTIKLPLRKKLALFRLSSLGRSKL